jgi:hypothetical protein
LEWWVINFKDNVKRIIGKKCKRECWGEWWLVEGPLLSVVYNWGLCRQISTF